MSRPSLRPIVWALSTLLTGAASPAAAAEYSIIASRTLVAGPAEDSAWQALVLRYTRGDAWQVRFDLPVLFAETSPGVARTGLGPVESGSFRYRGGAGGPGQGAGLVTDNDDDRQVGLGDLRLATNWRLAGGGARLFRLDGGIEVKAPTADEEKNLGTGEWDLRAGISAEYRFWSATAFGGMGWNRLGDPDWGELRDVVDAYAGLDSEPLAGRVIVSGWLEGYPEVVEESRAWTAIGTGLRTTGMTRFRTNVVVGVGEASGDFRVMVGISMGEAVSLAGARGALR